MNLSVQEMQRAITLAEQMQESFDNELEKIHNNSKRRRVAKQVRKWAESKYGISL